MISTEKWYKKFVEEFVKATEDNANEIGIHFEKYNVRGTETNTEWTYCMAPFLYKLAHKMGYFQECKNLDFLWYKGAVMHPDIAIEHENDWKEEVLTSEIPKLLSDDPDDPQSRAYLRILISYSNDIPTEDILRKAKKAVVSNIGRKTYEFLIVIGGELYQPSDWKGFTWDDGSSDWVPVR